MSALTPTSYALLGLLADQPRSTYELVEQMKRNLRFFWPGAESSFYAEPKNLVAHGLARAQSDDVGRRPRTVYAITAAGERALRKWLASPASPLSLTFEAQVRVLFASRGTPAQLADAIRSVLPLADEIKRAGAVVAGEYLAGSAPYPERIHLSGLTFDFLWGFAEHLRRWATDSLDEVSRWKDLAPAGKEARARRVFARAVPTTTTTTTTSRARKKAATSKRGTRG